MATPLLGLYAPATSADVGTWGDNWNNQGSTYLDNLIANITSLSLSSSNTLLTAAQARNQMIRCTGTLLANVSISPDAGVLWNGIRCVENLTSGSFTITLSNAGGSVVVPQGRRALVFLDTSNGPRIVAIAGSATADPVPTGAKTIWYNAAAPAGWTAVALNDYAIKIVTAGLGGVTSGSVAYSTLFARTATDSHTLTTAQIPSHTHDVKYGLDSFSGGPGPGVNSISSAGAQTGSAAATATGGGNGHTHDIDMRVQTAAFTLATKD